MSNERRFESRDGCASVTIRDDGLTYEDTAIKGELTVQRFEFGDQEQRLTQVPGGYGEIYPSRAAIVLTIQRRSDGNTVDQLVVYRDPADERTARESTGWTLSGAQF